MKQQALGSGFLVDAQGHVVTNAHVVDDADVVKVKLADDREYRAKVVGKDDRLDVAVLKLEDPPHDLPVRRRSARATPLRVGEYVVAIGNPFGLGNTVTMGIVSAKGRTIGAGPYDDFIQTDASINPGNSGGPLFNLRGQVVGINTAINPQGKGIGFAIPIDAVEATSLPQLLATGHVSRGRLGRRHPGDGRGPREGARAGPPARGARRGGRARQPGREGGPQVGRRDRLGRRAGRPPLRGAAAYGRAGTPRARRCELGVLHDKHERDVDVTLASIKEEGSRTVAGSQGAQRRADGPRRPRWASPYPRRTGT